jgi:tetratricopeptide (TPR) repeat protein
MNVSSPMPNDEFRIFLSAVTSEFGKARDALGADLRARGHEVTVQSDFQQSPDSETLLGTLSDYIRDCHAVVCIVGGRSGACPPPRAAKDLAARFDGVLPDGIKGASYTQWEFFLARHFRRRPYVYIARDDYQPDRDAPGDRTELQAAFLQYLKVEGVHYTPFSNVDQLARAVLKDEPKIAGKPEHVPRSAAKPIVLPYPSIGSLFKGRDEIMQRLHASRAGGGRTAIVNALYGLGGIGKTRAAVEYAWAHQDDYEALLFVVAETPEALRRNVAGLAGTLVPQLETTDDTARFASVVDWLRTNPGWLLILDNVDSTEAMTEVERLLAQLTGRHVIITSRLGNFSANVTPLELDVLDAGDAAAFLLQRTEGRRRPAADDEAKAREVAVELGQLALALEQASAYIAKHRLTFSKYQEQWRASGDKVLAWFDPTVTGYSCAVAATWQTSVAQLTEHGRRLLERLAWLGPEAIPEFLLDVPIKGAEGEDLRDALTDLAAYSLVTRDAKGPFFLVHRLVQDVTRRSLAGDGCHRSLTEALNWSNDAFVGDPGDVRNWPRFDPLAPHAQAMAGHADAAGVAAPTSRLMTQLGILLMAKALHAEAEQLMRRALCIDENTLGLDHPDVATGFTNLGQLLHTTTRLPEAEPLMRRALSISEKSLGPDHPSVGIRLSNLAGLLNATNRAEEAELHYRRALGIFEKSREEDRYGFATCLNNFAELLRATKRFREAEPLMRQALAIDEGFCGPNHPSVARDLNNLAMLLRATKRGAKAEPLFRRALAIDERSYGPHHPNVARDLVNLAGLLGATRRLADAEPLYRRALAIDEKCYGREHPEVAVDLHNIAHLLFNSNRGAEAEPLMHRSVAILAKFEKSTGHQHPYFGLARRHYANLLKGLGRTKREIKAALTAVLSPQGGAGDRDLGTG